MANQPPLLTGAHVTSTVAVTRGEHRLYYAGADGHHSSIRHNKISVATLRPDGFAGWRRVHANASDPNGGSSRLTTRAVNIAGSSLSITLDVSANAGGELWVGLLDAASGMPLPGFHIGDCVPLVATGTDVLMHWKASADLSDLVGRAVLVEMSLRGVGVMIYSYTFG